MGDMLSTAVTGLEAFQTALSTISNNISNAQTAGYSVENTNLATNQGQGTSQGYIGSGVDVASITRSYSESLAAQTRSATSSYNQLNTVSTLADNINNMLGDPTTGLSASLSSFSSSLQTLAGSPTETSARQAVLSQAQNLVTQLQSYQGSLAQTSTQVNTSITSVASTVSSLATNIASLNTQIVQAQNATGQTPNTLLDQRDNLVDQLSQNVAVSTTIQSNGAMNVYIGSGQPLVVGSSAATLTASADQYNSGALQLNLQSGNASTQVNITSSISGGILGGDLQFQQQMLTPALNTIGQVAVAVTSLVNTQNSAGLDQSGNFGTALLAVGGPQVNASSNNTGTETVSASLTDLASLTTSNYDLTYTGGNWSLTDTASGAQTALTSSTTGTAPNTTTTLTGAGLTLTVSNSSGAANGDSFLIQPTAGAVAGLKLLTNDPTKIAAADPLLTSAATTNTGTGSIDAGSITNSATWQGVRGNYTLNFTAANAYTITNSSNAVVSSGTYTSGSPIDFEGAEVTVSGTPAVNDKFSIEDNVNGTGDNRNALALAGITAQKALGGSTQSISDVVTGYISQVGLQTGQAQNGATAQQSVMQSAQTTQSNLSGVNLDEEAAKMVQMENAYQAAAEVIKTAETLFQSIISAFQSG